MVASSESKPSTSPPSPTKPSTPPPSARIPAGDDDPHSELNILRREVRQLQASVRDSALQITVQQDEVLTLRKSLAAAEAEIEDLTSREASLRSQLQQQRLKRERVENTMSAAEALLASLHEMIQESPSTPPPPSPLSPASRLIPNFPPLANPSGTHDKLDLLLSKIDPSPQQSTSPTHTRASPVVMQPDEVSNITLQHSPVSENPSQQVQQVVDPDDHAQSQNSQPSRPRSASVTVTRPSISQPPANTRSLSQGSPLPSGLLLSAFGQQPVGPTAADTPAVVTAGVHDGEPLPSAMTAMVNVNMNLKATSLPTSVQSAQRYVHEGDIFTLSSTPDGNWLASGGDDKTVKVFDSTARQPTSIGGIPRSVTAVALFPEPSNPEFPMIYAGSGDGSVRCFKRGPGKRKLKWSLASVYPVHTQTVRQLLLSDASGFSNSPGLVLTCSTDRSIKISDIETSRRPFSVATPSAVLDVSSFGTSGDGVIVSAHKDGGVRLWSARDQEASVGGAKVHSKPVTSVACLEDGHGVVSLGRDNALRLSDRRMDLAVVKELDGGVETVSDWHRVAVSGKYVACGLGKTGHLGVWDGDSGKMVRKISSQAPNTDGDVLKLMARKMRSPSCVVVPHWTRTGLFVCAHQSDQISYWNSSYLDG